VKVFVCTDHDGHWPVGTASVVVAPDEKQARVILRQALRDRWLDDEKPFTLREIDTHEKRAHVLCDGDY
jgi:hypothetical protein